MLFTLGTSVDGRTNWLRIKRPDATLSKSWCDGDRTTATIIAVVATLAGVVIVAVRRRTLMFHSSVKTGDLK